MPGIGVAKAVFGVDVVVSEVRQLRVGHATPIGVQRFSGADARVLGNAYVSISLQLLPARATCPSSKLPIRHTMRWLLSFAFAFAWAAGVQAKSFAGSRLLVVLEEQAEREKYSVFLEDLTGRFRCFSL